MPIIDLIPNQENKTFDGSTGDFSGDCDWHPGPILGHTGLIRILLPGIDGETGNPYPKTIQISAPAINTIPDSQHYLYLLCITEQITDPYIFHIEISDGNYLEENTQSFEGTHQQVQWLGWAGYLEIDWNTGGTQIQVTLTNPGLDPFYLYIDAFQMYADVANGEPPTSRPDHLPIIGIA